MVLRLLVFAIAGFFLGAGATWAVDAISAPPLGSSLIVLMVLCGFGVLLRKLELPAFLSRAAAFSYAAYLGVAVLRFENASARLTTVVYGQHADGMTLPGLVLLVLVVGVAFAGGLVALATLAWGLAQRLDRPKLDARADAFLKYLDERK